MFWLENTNLTRAGGEWFKVRGERTGRNVRMGSFALCSCSLIQSFLRNSSSFTSIPFMCLPGSLVSKLMYIPSSYRNLDISV